MTDYCPQSGKVQHATQNCAAKAMRNKGSVYRCKACHFWHHSSFTDKTMDRHSRHDLRKARSVDR